MTLDNSVRKYAGKAIKIVRVFNGYSSKELYIGLGIDPADFSKLESGKHKMRDLGRLHTCAEIMKVLPSELEYFSRALYKGEVDEDVINFYQRLNDYRIQNVSLRSTEGDSLRIIRQLLGIRQGIVAATADLNPATVCSYEAMQHLAKTRTIENVCSVLDIGSIDLSLFSQRAERLDDDQNARQKTVLMNLHRRWKDYKR